MSEVTPEAHADRVESALRTRGQRRINVIWESTQAFVAVAVTGATLYAACSILTNNDLGKTAFVFLTNVFFTVIGFYFGRTNHQRVGGVGSTGGRSL